MLENKYIWLYNVWCIFIFFHVAQGSVMMISKVRLVIYYFYRRLTCVITVRRALTTRLTDSGNEVSPNNYQCSWNDDCNSSSYLWRLHKFASFLNNLIDLSFVMSDFILQTMWNNWWYELKNYYSMYIFIGTTQLSDINKRMFYYSQSISIICSFLNKLRR